MGETTLTSGRPFSAAAGEILGREPSGGRLAFEEVARLLGLEVGARGVVICVKRRESGRTTWVRSGRSTAMRRVASNATR